MAWPAPEAPWAHGTLPGPLEGWRRLGRQDKAPMALAWLEKAAMITGTVEV